MLNIVDTVPASLIPDCAAQGCSIRTIKVARGLTLLPSAAGIILRHTQLERCAVIHTARKHHPGQSRGIAIVQLLENL